MGTHAEREIRPGNFAAVLLIAVLVSALAAGPAFGQVPGVEYFRKGAEAFQGGNFHEAEIFLEQALNENPDIAPAYHLLGIISRNNGASEQAAWYFNETIRKDPNYLAAYEDMGRMYQTEGKTDEAIFFYEELLKKDPNRTNAHFSLAWIYLLGKSEPRPAAQHFEAVVKATKAPKAYYGLGLAYSMMREQGRVLGIITELKQMNERELAAKLEDTVRTPFSPQPVQRPQPPQQQTQSVLVPNVKPAPPPPQPQVPAGVTRVRLRGKLYPIPPEQ